MIRIIDRILGATQHSTPTPHEKDFLDYMEEATARVELTTKGAPRTLHSQSRVTPEPIEALPEHELESGDQLELWGRLGTLLGCEIIQHKTRRL
ncbi:MULTISPECIES: hypothetical protein [unclassified Thioalkalivibrio]|uniref:hypothetical protein n=1 Tax=unclassified Thioalkalivibrio TaxID=2621013 RepID=UPI000382C92F|nr:MULTISPECIES: hypothetical protein [unclassified Thioalkalivibrio]